MEPQQRQPVIEELASTEARLLNTLDGLMPAQWHFRESPSRWSIAENLEHLIAFEGFILAAIRRTLDAPPELDKMAAAVAKEHLVLSLAQSRDTKFLAREIVRPTGRWTGTTAMIEEFHQARGATIAFVNDTRFPLREHFFPHIAFGDLDCYQWLIVLGQHTGRHVAQIEQIKADRAYPTT